MKDTLIEELKALYQFQGIGYQIADENLDNAIQNLIDEIETFLSNNYDMSYEGLEIDDYFEDYD